MSSTSGRPSEGRRGVGQPILTDEFSAQINWFGMGSVDVDTAKFFVTDMVKAVDFAKRIQAAFEEER